MASLRCGTVAGGSEMTAAEHSAWEPAGLPRAVVDSCTKYRVTRPAPRWGSLVA